MMTASLLFVTASLCLTLPAFEEGFDEPSSSAEYKCNRKFVDQDIDGGAGLGKSTGVSESDCCALCHLTPGCVAYVFNRWINDTCWYKTTTQPVIHRKSTYVGILYKEFSECWRLVDVDIYGGQLSSVSNVSLSDCCNMCSAQLNCKAFVWDDKEGCHFKRVMLEHENDTASNESTCRRIYKADILGNDLRAVWHQPEEACCAICRETYGCVAYAWNTMTEGACYLKNQSYPVIRAPIHQPQRTMLGILGSEETEDVWNITRNKMFTVDISKKSVIPCALLEKVVADYEVIPWLIVSGAQIHQFEKYDPLIGWLLEANDLPSDFKGNTRDGSCHVTLLKKDQSHGRSDSVAFKLKVIGERSLTTGAITAVTIGTLVVVCSIVGAFVIIGMKLYISRSLKKVQRRLNKSMVESRTYYTSRNSYKKENTNLNASTDPYITVGAGASSEDDLLAMVHELTYDRGFEVPADRLTLVKEIGIGHFGKVYEGELKLCTGNCEKVAVKAPKSKYNWEHYTSLVDELKVLSNLEHHPNVLALIGAVTEQILEAKLCVVLEFCKLGELRTLLHENKNAYMIAFEHAKKLATHENAPSNDIDSEIRAVSAYRVETAVESLSTARLLSYCYQVANGMSFLTKKLVHRDLAARNLLLTENHVVKIADFGLSRESMYQMNASSQNALPIKWMAPECLSKGIFTTKSDTFAFGIVLWEVFSLGDEPYPGLPTDPFFILSYLQSGRRMDKPKYAPASIYSMMLKCWTLQPEERPLFSELTEMLEIQLRSCSEHALEQLETLLGFELERIRVLRKSCHDEQKTEKRLCVATQKERSATELTTLTAQRSGGDPTIIDTAYAGI